MSFMNMDMVVRRDQIQRLARDEEVQLLTRSALTTASARVTNSLTGTPIPLTSEQEPPEMSNVSRDAVIPSNHGSPPALAGHDTHDSG